MPSATGKWVKMASAGAEAGGERWDVQPGLEQHLGQPYGPGIGRLSPRLGPVRIQTRPCIPSNATALVTTPRGVGRRGLPGHHPQGQADVVALFQDGDALVRRGEL